MAENDAGTDFEQLSMFGMDILPQPEPKVQPKPAKPPKEAKSARSSKVTELYDVDTLRISQSQPRVYIAEAELEELTASIQKHGVLQPVLVQAEDTGDHVLIAGQRRLLAARKAGLKKIPGVLTGGDPFEIALIENLQRSDLTCMEEAEAMHRLKERNGYSLDELRAIVGKSKTTVSETLSLVRLPAQIREECLHNPEIAKSILVEIARKPSEAEMIQAYERYQREKLPRHLLRNGAEAEKARKKVGVGFVKSVAQKIEHIDVESLKKKQREQMKSRLEELHGKIGALIVRLG
ncbi:ParB/RepB/Spo0J family partition protein [Geomesophilobacter sediminis]|uniref:ParB/RepB/Spo0J family partition protein n=1 Tax=Geomesophilobacter sediminis TaxID=2798584 RepID=A0A8J7JHT1_9BACT|nr:ParB/RepB/Spo0J family partition protein [Geomesophilobacter sediminis]MBJ6724020.1 ParB/RepB/Spo0J family partition protein [Geomesophilobacter sediminis]